MVVAAGVGGAVGFFRNHAQAIVRAGVVGFLDTRGDLQATAQGLFTARQIAAGLGDDSAKGVEGEVVVGLGQQEGFAGDEGFVVAFLAAQGVGFYDSAAGRVAFFDLGDVRVGPGKVTTDKTGGAGVELDETLAVVDIGGVEFDGLFERGAAAAGVADGGEGDPQLGGAQQAGAAVVGENFSVGGGEFGRAGKGVGGGAPALHLELALAEIPEGAGVFGFAGDQVGELGPGLGDAFGVEQGDGGGERGGIGAGGVGRVEGGGRGSGENE